MAIKYLSNNESKCKVFPSSFRQMEMDYSARLQTEHNITGQINRLSDNKAFVISNNKYQDNINIGIARPSSSEHTPIEFNIQGYNFEVNYAEDIIDAFEYPTPLMSDGDIIYANIYIDQQSRTNDGVTYIEQAFKGIIEGAGTYSAGSIDDLVTGEFQGIGYSLEPIEAENVYSLALIRKDVESNNTYYRIPDESMLKLKTDNEHSSVLIDDGEL